MIDQQQQQQNVQLLVLLKANFYNWACEHTTASIYYPMFNKLKQDVDIHETFFLLKISHMHDWITKISIVHLLSDVY